LQLPPQSDTDDSKFQDDRARCHGPVKVAPNRKTMIDDHLGDRDPRRRHASIIKNVSDGLSILDSSETTDPNSDVEETNSQQNLNNQDGNPDIDIKKAGRTANVSRNPSGEARGAAVWLNASELSEIGIDIDSTEAIEVKIVDGDLNLVSAGGTGN